ncbi:MAG: N-acetylmuramoyl-L-alanine amidase [Clostridia bacterium]
MSNQKIYLSPSKQATNSYCVGKTNEQREMEALAKLIKKLLDKAAICETVIATSRLTIDLQGRAREAKNHECELYLALHSNAGGPGIASGAVAFYHPAQAAGKKLAARIISNLHKICPVKSNRSAPLQNGMAAFSGYGLAEIRNPSKLGMIAVLAETDFHDNSRTAQWMINNKEKIAIAYVEAIRESWV